MVSPFLYSGATDATVITVGKAPAVGQVAETASNSTREKGTRLSYGELLEVLLASQRIITL